MALMERQMLDLRADVQHLQSRTFTELSKAHATVVAQFRALLPQLAAEAASRVLAGVLLSQDTVLGIVGEMLQNIEPGSPDLEATAGQRVDHKPRRPNSVSSSAKST